MKTYNVTFDCLIPCEVTTMIEAKNKEEVIEKIVKQKYNQYRFITKGNFQQIHKVRVEETELNE